jgi:type IV pilus assembly protein PilM
MAAQVFGLDIGSAFTKVAEIKGDASRRDLVSVGMIPTPGKGALSDAEGDQRAIAESIRNLTHEAKISTPFVVASLPESQIFTRVIEMATLTDSELQSAIKYEAEQYIPVPLTEVKLDYSVLSRPKDQKSDQKMEVLLVAAPTALINRYLKIINMAGLKPHALETEITATNRALIETSEFAPTSLIVAIGASTTDLSIVSGKKIVFTRSIAIGGLAFTRAIAQDLGFEAEQAEEYKKTYGLDPSQLEGKIAASIKPIFDVITNEIQRALAFWSSRHQDDSVKRLVVTGGGAKLPGVIPYLTEATSLEGQLGNTWQGVSVNETLLTEIRDDGPFYGVAVGLAMKELAPTS